MEAPSKFLFIETGIPTSRRGAYRGSTARSLIRSHAMHQVWEQRRLQRAQGHAERNFEVILQNQSLEAAEKSNASPSTRPPNTEPANGGSIDVRQHSSRILPRSYTLDEDVGPSRGKVRMDDSKVQQPQGNDGKSLRRRRMPVKRGANPYEDDSHTQRTSCSTPSPVAIGMCLMDPFDTCAVALDFKDSRYMTHYFQAFSWRFTLPKRTWLRYAIHDAGLLHGVLAIAAAHYSFATTQGLSDDALFHHGKTINHVQKCLADPMLRFSDGVIGAIGRMVICHLIFGNRQHFITHLEALRRITEARGGLESLGMVGQLKYVIASCVAGAATIWWRDVPAQLKHPYGFLEYPAVEDVREAEPCDPESGSAFRNLNSIGFLSNRMVDICDAVVALNSYIRSQGVWDEPQQRVFGDQCNKMSLRLIYLKESEALGHFEATERDHMCECIRLAVHFYVVVFQRDVPLLSNLSIQTLHQLQSFLCLTDLENSWGGGQLGEALLWVLTIAVSGCVMPKEREWMGAHLRKTATQLGITQWVQVTRICKRFLSLENTAEWKTRLLWENYGHQTTNNSLLAGPVAAGLQPANESCTSVEHDHIDMPEFCHIDNPGIVG